MLHTMQMKNLENIRLSNTLLLYNYVYIKCPEKANPYRQKVDKCLPGAGDMGEWQ